MNAAQRLVLVLGFAGAAGMAAVPPWFFDASTVVTLPVPQDGLAPPDSWGDYRPVFDPPGEYRALIDWPRLGAQLVALAAATGAAYFAVGRWRAKTHGPQTPQTAHRKPLRPQFEQST